MQQEKTRPEITEMKRAVGGGSTTGWLIVYRTGYRDGGVGREKGANMAGANRESRNAVEWGN